jgi:uncharacterized membrane protein
VEGSIERDKVFSARHALSSLALGVASGGLVALAGAVELAPVVAWTIAASAALVWIWRVIWPQDAAGTERLAEAEARTRTTDAAVLVATVASLGTVGYALAVTSSRHDAMAAGAVLLSLVAIILSWALANTVFALKYARLYYLDEDGGIEFGDEPPAYSDFAYIAFTIGMAFGPPEGDALTAAPVRRAALGHALFSYGFGTGIIAAAVNLVSGLGQS